MTDLLDTIKQRLSELEPSVFELTDTSGAHVGHASYQLGNAHLALRIASEKFKDLNTVACHRLIYILLGDLIPHPIHALSIQIVR